MKKRIFLRPRSGLVIIFILALLLGGCAKESPTETKNIKSESQLTENVIYGSDGRMDLYQASDALKTLADSTVALIKTSKLTAQGSSVFITGESFAESHRLCSSEKFREQNLSAFCSGALVGPDLIITAGHCITNQSDCVDTSFVFGFAVKSAGILPAQVNSGEVYRCREIVHRVLENTGVDYAVIKLDRSVSNHTALPIRRVGELSVGDPLVVIGHPVGLPTKITVGGKVRSTANSGYLVTNLDTYGGNSGSAVFNANTGVIEGILVRGEQDFTYANGCNTSKVCSDDSCRGEDVIRISTLRSYIPVPAPTPNSEVFSSSSTLTIPDNNATGVASYVKVSSTPKGRKVLISVNVVHSYIGDLVIKVVASDGRTVTLHSRSGGSADNVVKTYDATAALSNVSNTGYYKLVIQDMAKYDVGSLKSWSVKFAQ